MTEKYFPGAGFRSHGVYNLTPVQAHQACLEGALLIDVRENYHSFLHTFDVRNLFYCPLSELSAHFDRIPANQPVILADAAGLKSREAVLLLMEKGYDNIANLAGGMLEWNRENMPVKSDKTRRMSGSC
ncbi:MAG: rhodanese-like domain-containing protein, partial [Bacteroidales bacterium]